MCGGYLDVRIQSIVRAVRIMEIWTLGRLRMMLPTIRSISNCFRAILMPFELSLLMDGRSYLVATTPPFVFGISLLGSASGF